MDAAAGGNDICLHQETDPVPGAVGLRMFEQAARQGVGLSDRCGSVGWRGGFRSRRWIGVQWTGWWPVRRAPAPGRTVMFSTFIVFSGKQSIIY
jgi:hypothetical protein